MQHKIFVVGFPKTGTMSLGKALKLMRYRVCRHLMVNGNTIKVEGEITREKLAESCLKIVDQYDAFRNFPWSVIYKQLDANVPNAKFILTRRNSDEWIESAVRHFGDKPLGITEPLCGRPLAPSDNKELFLSLYQQHNEEVIAYFKSRPEKLLVVDIESADWPALCGFLNRRKPLLRAFPHRNRGDFRAMSLTRLQKVIRYNLDEFVRPITGSR